MKNINSMNNEKVLGLFVLNVWSVLILLVKKIAGCDSAERYNLFDNSEPNMEPKFCI